MEMMDGEAKVQMVMVCEPARESDLESYTSVQVEEMMLQIGNGDGSNGTGEGSSETMMMYYEIDPTRSQSRSSTEMNTSSCSRSRSSSFDTKYVMSKESTGAGVSKPHKAQDGAWEAIARVKARYGGIGLGHFRFLQRLGSGDIGSVYLAQLKRRHGRRAGNAADAEEDDGEDEEEEEEDEDEEEEEEDAEEDAMDGGGAVYFAVKVMDKRALAGRNKLVRAQTELEILQALDHPFLPTLYAHLDDRHFSCLVMEFCPGGDLHVLRQRQPNKRFCENAVRFYAAEVLLALEYLHIMGIVYRDLKPENVLVREDGHIMLSDFDLSLKCTVDPVLFRLASVRQQNQQSQYLCMPRGKSSGRCVAPCSVHPIASCLPVPCFMTMALASSSSAKTKSKAKASKRSSGRSAMPELVAEPTSVRSMSFVGTHEYLAPEIIVGDGHGSAVDWWTFGIFLFELLHGRTPFKGADNEMTLMNVVTQALKFPASEGLPDAVDGYPSAAAQDLIRGLLVKDPTKRMAASRGAPEIKQHPFFAGVNWALIRCAIPPEIPSPFSVPPSLPKTPKSDHSAHVRLRQRKLHSHSTSEDFDMF